MCHAHPLTHQILPLQLILAPRRRSVPHFGISKVVTASANQAPVSQVPLPPNSSHTHAVNECKRQLYFSQSDLDPCNNRSISSFAASKAAGRRSIAHKPYRTELQSKYSRDTRRESPFLGLAPPSPSVTTQLISRMVRTYTAPVRVYKHPFEFMMTVRSLLYLKIYEIGLPDIAFAISYQLSSPAYWARKPNKLLQASSLLIHTKR